MPISLTHNASIQDTELDDADDTPFRIACTIGYEPSECVTVNNKCDDT